MEYCPRCFLQEVPSPAQGLSLPLTIPVLPVRATTLYCQTFMSTYCVPNRDGRQREHSAALKLQPHIAPSLSSKASASWQVDRPGYQGQWWSGDGVMEGHRHRCMLIRLCEEGNAGEKLGGHGGMGQGPLIQPKVAGKASWGASRRKYS